MTDRVGVGIVEVITESLYDDPIVVFREYVQNSADALSLVENEQNKSDLLIDIWKSDKNLYFLDNGCGIDANSFKRKMSSIADSVKNRSENIGYKGIGRLSGLSYCRKLSFINIIDFQINSLSVHVSLQPFTFSVKIGLVEIFVNKWPPKPI